MRRLSRKQCISGMALWVLLGAPAMAQIVSSGPDAEPLPPPAVVSTRLPAYVPLDVSENGRYVLFSNYQPFTASFYWLNPQAGECAIYRKDRATGELLTVFSSTPGERYYCEGALMSADGNVVVAPPVAPPEIVDPEPEVVDGQICRNFGEVRELTVRDINADTTRDVVRERVICSSGAGIFIPLEFYEPDDLRAFSGDATAVLTARRAVVGQIIVEYLGVVDLTDDSFDDLSDGFDDFTLTDEAFRVTGISWSNDGSRMAVSALVGDSAVVPSFGLDANSDAIPATASLWPEFPLAEPALLPLDHRVWLVERADNTVTELEDLRRTNTPVPGLQTDFFRIRPDSLSNSGRILTWVEAPPLCLQPSESNPFGNYVPCGPTLEPCAGEECELKIVRYEIATGERDEQFTQVRDESSVGASNAVRIAANGARILYPRRVKNPFGGDWMPLDTPAFGDPPVCVSRSSVDSMSGVPVIEDCEDTGPVIGPSQIPTYAAPLLWYFRDLNSDLEILLSVVDGNRLVQSTQAELGNNGRTVALFSHDPRFRRNLDGLAGLDESLLPPECFWQSQDGPGNLRVATNDNVYYVTTDTQYRYAATPVFCLAPTPAVEGQVYAGDFPGAATGESAPVYVSSGAFGWLLVPLALLGWWRRQSRDPFLTAGGA